MAAPLPPFVPLDGRFGAVTTLLPSHHAARDFVEAAEASPAVLREAINAGRGLLLVRGLAGVVEEPELLVRLTRLFGAAESYRDEGRSAPAYLSDECHQIAVVSNAPPANRDGKRSSSLRVFFRSLRKAAALVPDKPEPELTPAGTIPTQYPHRRGWHTDDSFRRPPPDFSLFFAARPAPPGQGQTLFADMTGAWEALPAALRAEVAEGGLCAAHTNPWVARSRDDVLSGASLLPTPARAQAFGGSDSAASVWQPVLCRHPETSRTALYLSDCCQLDFLDGPLRAEGRRLELGPHGSGDELMRRIVSHCTQERFVYVQDWQPNDLIVYDNRCTMHCGTHFDPGFRREMWRTVRHIVCAGLLCSVTDSALGTVCAWECSA